MTVKLLTKHHLEFLSLKGGCRGSFGSTTVKMPHCLKSHVTTHLIFLPNFVYFQIVNGDIQPNYHHKGYKKVDNTTAVRRAESMQSHVTPNDIWLKDVRHVLKEVYTHFQSTFTSLEFFV